VVNVSYSASDAGEAQDLTDDLDPPGTASAGNVFQFDPSTESWRYQLGTRPYSAVGTYTVTMTSGDASSYIIEPTCSGKFERLD
jgi:hypothetical protein